MKKKIGTIIIAAGYSSRMEGFKPLLKFGNQTAVERVVMTHQKAGVDQIILVVGHRAAAIKSYFKKSSFELVTNERYDEGMYSSIIKGINQLDMDVDAFFVHPVDIPLIKVGTIKAMMASFQIYNKGILYPCFMDERGHPPLIDKKYREDILSNKIAGGLKQLLASHETDTVNLALADESILMDMDTWTDYQALLDYDGLMAPTLCECYAIMDLYQLPDQIRKHSEMVSRVAGDMVRRLDVKGIKLDGALLRSAALLHDLLRTNKNHAQEGANLLARMGYEKVGNLISTHMDIHVNPDAVISENEVLYLADKLVEEDQLIDLNVRKKKMIEQNENNPKVLEKIKKRFDHAMMIYIKISKLSGRNLWNLTDIESVGVEKEGANYTGEKLERIR